MSYAMRLKENLAKSDQLILEMKTSVNSYEHFSELLKEYIRLRYVIDDTDFWTDDIRELSRFSMLHQQKAIGDDRNVLKDTSLRCAGATSSDTKQILLLMKLRKDMGVELDPAFIGTVKSVAAVSQRLFSQLQELRCSTRQGEKE